MTQRTALVACSLVAACGGSPTTPAPGVDRVPLREGLYNLALTGPESVFRPCTSVNTAATGVAVAKDVMLSHEGREWVARPVTRAGGDFELRFRDTGAAGAGIPVSGSARGSSPPVVGSFGTIWPGVAFAGTTSNSAAQVEGTAHVLERPGTRVDAVFGRITGTITFVDILAGYTMTCGAVQMLLTAPVDTP